MPYQDTAPTINPNTFPYRRKWTRAETDEIGERIDQLRDDMVDMVSLSGVLMYIDAGSIANIASHLALAGWVKDDDRAYIWRDAKSSKDDLFEQVQWHVKKDVEPPPPERKLTPEEIAEQARIAREQVESQLHPEVKKVFIANLAKEFRRDTTDPEPEEGIE